MPSPAPLWFDAHLDLACMAVCGRDMTAPLDRCGGPMPPASVTLPSLLDGHVRFALATIFLEADGAGPEGYPASDSARAFLAARAQLEAYLTWQDKGLLAIDLPRALRADPGVGQIRAGMGVAETIPTPVESRAANLARADRRLHVGILMEGADPIRTPDDAAWWRDRGVCAVGLAWWKPSRYAGGNGSSHGLTDLGRALVPALSDLGVVHDLSHLSDASARDLLELTGEPVIASHSNCRALMPPLSDGSANQRHLSDDLIAEITRRGGMIGLNLYGKFLRDERAGPATVDDALAHIERVCDITGSRAHVGLGSDMDGGFSAEALPTGIRTPRDLRLLTDAHAARGWSESEVDGFRSGNWLRFWERAAAPARAPGRIGAA